VAVRMPTGAGVLRRHAARALPEGASQQSRKPVSGAVFEFLHHQRVKLYGGLWFVGGGMPRYGVTDLAASGRRGHLIVAWGRLFRWPSISRGLTGRNPNAASRGAGISTPLSEGRNRLETKDALRRRWRSYQKNAEIDPPTTGAETDAQKGLESLKAKRELRVSAASALAK